MGGGREGVCVCLWGVLASGPTSPITTLQEAKESPCCIEEMTP